MSIIEIVKQRRTSATDCVHARNATTPRLSVPVIRTLRAEAAGPVVPVCARELPRNTLRRWNLAMFLFHSVLATVTLTLGNIDLQVPTYKTLLDFVRYNTTDSEEVPWRLVPSLGKSWELPVTLLVAAFFLLSAVFHLLNATLLRHFYEEELILCRTPTRWTEYFFSAPIMIIIIAYTLGVRDRSVLLSTGVLVAVTMPFGYWTETIARPRTANTWTEPLSYRLFPWFLGHVPQTAAWLLIILQFYDSQADPSDTTPAFVHVILWSELVLFFSFGAAALLSQLMPPKYFYRGELLFQVLSLVSKGLLGGLLIANVLMLSRFEDIYDETM